MRKSSPLQMERPAIGTECFQSLYDGQKQEQTHLSTSVAESDLLFIHQLHELIVNGVCGT